MGGCNIKRMGLLSFSHGVFLLVCHRWEEERHEDGVKWKSLEHKGPVFASSYEPLPKDVKFKYQGKEMKLSTASEEVASFYAHMLDHDYVTKEIFNKILSHPCFDFFLKTKFLISHYFVCLLKNLPNE